MTKLWIVKKKKKKLNKKVEEGEEEKEESITDSQLPLPPSMHSICPTPCSD